MFGSGIPVINKGVIAANIIMNNAKVAAGIVGANLESLH
jgi:hypothetical protein